jgi:tetratricopeptide (TPR) repeat protein
MIRRFLPAALAAPLVFGAAHARAYPIDLEYECRGESIEKASPERAVLACTTIMTSREVHPERMVDYVAARAGHYRALGQFENALADYDAAIGRRPRDSGLYNERCWTRAIWGHALFTALADCNAALRMSPGDADFLDSRALVHFRRGNYAAARADLDAALAKAPNSASSLFVRGLTRRKTGDAAGGDADIAAATAIDPKTTDKYAKYGVTQ